MTDGNRLIHIVEIIHWDEFNDKVRAKIAQQVGTDKVTSAYYRQ